MANAALSRSDVHSDAILSNYVQRDYAPQNMIGFQMAPAIQVNKESDIYYKKVTDKKHRNTLRAPGAPAGVVDISFGKGSYFCEEYAQASVLPSRIRENSDSILGLEKAKAQQAKDSVWLDMEIRIKDLAESCSYSNAASAPWNGALITPDPQLDIDTAMYNVYGRIGQMPNRIKLPVKAIMALDRYLKAAANISNPMSLTQRMESLENLWGLKVIPIFSQYDKAAMGQPEVLTQIWTATEAIVFYAEEVPSLEAQGWLQTFACRFKTGTWQRVRTWYDDKSDADYYEFSILAQPQVTNPLAAEKITTLLS